MSAANWKGETIVSLATQSEESTIEITPEMIRAGVDEVFQITEKEVVRIYLAMEAVRCSAIKELGRV